MSLFRLNLLYSVSACLSPVTVSSSHLPDDDARRQINPFAGTALASRVPLFLPILFPPFLLFFCRLTPGVHVSGKQSPADGIAAEWSREGRVLHVTLESASGIDSRDE